MKRLQFRHCDIKFSTREEAISYFNDIVDRSKVKSIDFGESLYAEPMIAKYRDEEGKEQIIFAIGVDSGKTPYHLIDSKDIYEKINKEELRAKSEEARLDGRVDDEIARAKSEEARLDGRVDAETERAKSEEARLDSKIDTETERAIAEESRLDSKIDAETERAKEEELKLQNQITNNIVKIESVEPSNSNILEEYSLKNTLGEVLGENIKIYKDNSLVTAKIGYQGATSVIQHADGSYELEYGEVHDENIEYLYLIYRDENGGLQLVGIDFENFILETEFGNGIKVVDRVASIKIKDGEKYLNTDKDGLHTINIDEAIKTSVDNVSDVLNTKIDAETERAMAAEALISATTVNFSGSVISEVSRLDVAIVTEQERAIAELRNFSGHVVNEVVRLDAVILAEHERTIADLKDFSGSVVSENVRIDNRIDAEIRDRENAIELEKQERTAAIDNERYDRDLADNQLQSNIEKEALDRENHVISLSGAVETEVLRLESVISLEEVRATNDLKSFSGNVVAEFTRIDNAISEEARIRDEKDSKIVNDLNIEVSNRKDADDSLKTQFTTEISKEIDRATNEEARLDKKIVDETTRAANEEIKLSDSIKELDNKIISNEITSKDLIVNKTELGTTISLQVDNKTITKVADNQNLEGAVLGTLLKVKRVEPTSSAIKSRYELQDGDGNLVGDAIELPVESALVDIKQGKEGDMIDPITGNYISDGTGDVTMNFVYRLEDGTYELMQIVVSDYFTDAHFGRGLRNHDGVISLAEGDGNEYLVISEDTISVIGVNDAINTSKDEIITIVNGEVSKLNLKISELESKVNILENRIKELEDTLDTRIFEILSTKIQGVDKEIKITSNNGILNIGFADNAIFGEF